MEKQEDPFDTMQTGVYMDSSKEEHDPFPYNMRKIREFLSATGKTLDSRLQTKSQLSEYLGVNFV